MYEVLHDESSRHIMHTMFKLIIVFFMICVLLVPEKNIMKFVPECGRMKRIKFPKTQ
jgi:hypothetical protein